MTDIGLTHAERCFSSEWDSRTPSNKVVAYSIVLTTHFRSCTRLKDMFFGAPEDREHDDLFAVFFLSDYISGILLSRYWASVQKYYSGAYLELCKASGCLQRPAGWEDDRRAHRVGLDFISHHNCARSFCAEMIDGIEWILDPKHDLMVEPYKKVYRKELNARFIERRDQIQLVLERHSKYPADTGTMLNFEVAQAMALNPDPAERTDHSMSETADPTPTSDQSDSPVCLYGVTLDQHGRSLTNGQYTVELGRRETLWRIASELWIAGAAGIDWQDLFSSVWPDQSCSRSNLDNRKRDLNNLLIPFGLEIKAGGGRWLIWKMSSDPPV